MEEFTNQLVGKLLGLSGLILKLTKKAALVGLGDDQAAGLEAIEKVYLDECMTTLDASEGLNAFLEKRQPNWQEK